MLAFLKARAVESAQSPWAERIADRPRTEKE